MLNLLMSHFMFVQAVKEFLDEVRSKEQPHSAGLVSQPTAIKFLMARKFDVSRAIELFQAYKVLWCFIKNTPEHGFTFYFIDRKTLSIN